jgi:hypothetical protein
MVRYSGHIAIPESVRKEDAERQERLKNERLLPTAGGVSVTSSTRDAVEGRPAAQEEEDVDMAAGIRSDFVSAPLL